MRQTQNLTLSEALVFVEKSVRDAAQCPLAPQVSLAMSRLLQREGDDVSAADIETETALLFSMVTTLCFFRQCNAAIVTDSESAAEQFFFKPLFSRTGPKGSGFAERCGKRLVSAWMPLQAGNVAEIQRLADVLNDCNAIPVLDFSALEQLQALVAGSAAAHEKSGWLKKLLIHESSAIQALRAGLGKLNCVVKVIGGTVSADGEVGVAPVLDWRANHQLQATAR